jgi:hypothetical protein
MGLIYWKILTRIAHGRRKVAVAAKNCGSPSIKNVKIHRHVAVTVMHLPWGRRDGSLATTKTPLWWP